MNKNDAKKFFDLWDDTAEVFGKSISGAAKQVIFRSLSNYRFVDVVGALNAHLADPERGRFMPKPADIIAQIDRVRPNAWLGAEEAWALFPRDESATGCVYDEMQKAFAVAVGLDEISGRMAFKETYNRLILEAKTQKRDPVWYMSLGTEAQERDEKTLDAMEAGRISTATAIGLLPHLPEKEIRALERKEISPQALLANNEQKLIGVDGLAEMVADRASDESSRKHLSEINELLGIRKKMPEDEKENTEVRA